MHWMFLADFDFTSVLMTVGIGFVCVIVGLFVLSVLIGLHYIPNNRVGIVEKLWSGKGSTAEGHIVALNGEAGYQIDLLRGGMHIGYFRWQYRIHKSEW